MTLGQNNDPGMLSSVLFLEWSLRYTMKVTQYNSIQYSYTVLTFFQTIVDSLDSPTRTLKLNYSKKNPCMGVLTFYNPFSPDEHFNISVK